MSDFSSPIYMEVFVTIHSSVFVLLPLAVIINRKNIVSNFLKLFFLRIILLCIGNFISADITAFIDFFGVFFGAFVLVPLLFMIKFAYNRNKVDIGDYIEVSSSELSAIGISDSKLITNRLVNQFIKVKKAYSSFDYDTISKYCTPKGYKYYKDQLVMHKEHNEKNYFKDTDVKDAKIIHIEYDKFIKITVVTVMSVTNYIVDSYGKIISGSDTKKRDVSYELSFIKYLEEDKDIKECPNCGAPLTNIHKCDYCNTVINFHVGEWLLNSEIILKERR